MQWFDAHNHLHDSRLGNRPEEIIARQRDAGITGCVVNATCEADWPVVSRLARQFPNFIRPAYGIHPWKAHTTTPGWQDRLRSLLVSDPLSTVGECGIDSWIHDPPLDVQIPVFLMQLEIARELQRPASIHCLKAWQPLFDCFQQQAPPASFLMHSFSGSLETAAKLLPMGAYFSLSGYLLLPRKENAIDTFRRLPMERILLETDAPDMLPPEEFRSHPRPDGWNDPANLDLIGPAIAARLHLTTLELSARTWINSRSWLSGPTPS